MLVWLLLIVFCIEFLQEDDMWPVCLQRKQVTVSSVRKIRNNVFSKLIAIELGTIFILSGLILICLQKLVLWENCSTANPVLRGEMFEVNLIPVSVWALMIIPSGIEEYTFDRIILFEGFINFLIGMILFSIFI